MLWPPRLRIAWPSSSAETEHQPERTRIYIHPTWSNSEAKVREPSPL
jgi:hypothetical protein